MYGRMGVYLSQGNGTLDLQIISLKKQDIWKYMESIRSTRVPKCANPHLGHTNGNKGKCLMHHGRSIHSHLRMLLTFKMY